MKLKKVSVSIFLSTLFACISFAGVDAVKVKSPSMNKEVDNVIVTPLDYTQNTSKRYPVVYLLHGHGGNAKSWIHIRPDLEQLATLFGMIIVCPDGKNSWYYDSPVDKSMRYETYVTKELVSYVDSNYRTIPQASHRALAGLSMGGHGAMWLGVRNQDKFCASGILSGGVDIRPFPKNWHLKDDLGDYENNKAVWDAHTCINLIHQIKPNYNIYIDCGTEDFFYKVNRNLHEQLLYYKIPHVYIARPGVHNGKYWNNAIDYQLLYFAKIFANNSKE